MFILVTGGSGSGKSEYAENRAMELGNMRIYAATMQAYGEEGRARVTRHQRMRMGKGFRTIECPADLENTLLPQVPADGVVLLECMSNLAANEMFGADPPCPAKETAERILRQMKLLLAVCRHVIVVTNEVFSDGGGYGAETMEYIRALGMINQEMGALADEVTEVVCGIPVFLTKPPAAGAWMAGERMAEKEEDL